MIRHIFTIIWNERKTNGWILMEYILVFCILWFCVDYLCFIVKGKMEPLGFDTEHVYLIEMAAKEYVSEETSKRDNAEDALLLMDRLSRYPGVTNYCIARQGVPYGGAYSSQAFFFTPDSLNETVRVRWVTSGFFDVFKMNLISGRMFNREDESGSKNIIINPDKADCFGQYPGATAKASELRTISTKDKEMQVVGIVDKVKDTFFEPYKSGLYYPLSYKDIYMWNQIAVRVAPEADKDFAERFMKEMQSRLEFGPYYLSSVTSFNDLKKKTTERYGITNRLNGVYAIMGFLVVNIFLGLIGTFWYRTQSRRSEIGLRLAMGASRREVMRMMFLETLLLLTAASIVAVNICLNIGQYEVLSAFDIPVGDRVQSGMGIEQDFLDYGLTFLFLAAVSLLAVWYPARQSARIPPAEALHEE